MDYNCTLLPIYYYTLLDIPKHFALLQECRQKGSPRHSQPWLVLSLPSPCWASAGAAFGLRKEVNNM